MKRFLYIVLFFLLAASVNAATYNYYFSDDATGNAAGNDTTGDGSQGNPWKTLSKAQTEIDALSSGDTANIYFDRGDTWTEVTGQLNYHFRVDSSDPTVHIDAYGSGSRPVFDGSISDFSTAAVVNTGTPLYKWYYRFFQFDKTNCSISNVEIKNVYGIGIFLSGGDGFTLSNSLGHNIGNSVISADAATGAEDCVVEYNVMHTGQQLAFYGKRAGTGWGGAVHFIAMGSGAASLCRNNTVRYNLVYDIYGEGINASSSTVEYNVIGDTTSLAIDVAPQDYDEYTSIVRYNFVIGSSSASYGQGTGVRIFDEMTGGDNSNGDISIYGNIFINRNYAIRVYCSTAGDGECGNTHGTARIYNNLSIDSITEDYRFSHPEEVAIGYAYNNVSIHYDRDGKAHATNAAHANWTFSHNAFWPVDVDDTVGTGWTTNYVTADPVLPGEAAAVDWDGQTGATYYHNIEWGTDIFPVSGALLGAGTTLASPYVTTFLSSSADYSDVLDGLLSTHLGDQPTPWNIGPFGGAVAATTSSDQIQGAAISGGTIN